MSIANVNVKGKAVVLRTPDYRGDTLNRVFECKDGFGCDPQKGGSAVFGEFLVDGEFARIARSHIARLATDEEVAQAKALNKKV